MIALVDADIVVYRVGFTTQADSEGIARARADETIELILHDTGASEYECWLSDESPNNFRAAIDPNYKANRKDFVKPVHYDCIKEHLVKEWGARFAYGMEADDALGIAQDKNLKPGKWFGFPDGSTVSTTTICSIDKDLLQIPGFHYNFVKKEWQEVTTWEGLKWFYSQILIGDVSDNVKGCSGIGPKKAEKALGPIGEDRGELALLQAVYSLYKRQEKAWSQEEILSHIRKVGSLLKIKQQEGEPSWDSQSYSLMEELRSSFTPPKPVESIQSTEPTIQAQTTEGGSLLRGNKMDISFSTANAAV